VINDKVKWSNDEVEEKIVTVAPSLRVIVLNDCILFATGFLDNDDTSTYSSQ
jgi:hypothetical protein